MCALATDGLSVCLSGHSSKPYKNRWTDWNAVHVVEPYATWGPEYPKGKGQYWKLLPTLECIRLHNVAARGCKLVCRGQCITDKSFVRLQNGLIGRGLTSVGAIWPSPKFFDHLLASSPHVHIWWVRQPWKSGGNNVLTNGETDANKIWNQVITAPPEFAIKEAGKNNRNTTRNLLIQPLSLQSVVKWTEWCWCWHCFPQITLLWYVSWRYSTLKTLKIYYFILLYNRCV